MDRRRCQELAAALEEAKKAEASTRKRLAAAKEREEARIAARIAAEKEAADRVVAAEKEVVEAEAAAARITAEKKKKLEEEKQKLMALQAARQPMPAAGEATSSAPMQIVDRPGTPAIGEAGGAEPRVTPDEAEVEEASYTPGTRVKIGGLVKRPDLNDRVATVKSFNDGTGRYNVHQFDPENPGKQLAVKPDNLAFADMLVDDDANEEDDAAGAAGVEQRTAATPAAAAAPAPQADAEAAAAAAPAALPAGGGGGDGGGGGADAATAAVAAATAAPAGAHAATGGGLILPNGWMYRWRDDRKAYCWLDPKYHVFDTYDKARRAMERYRARNNLPEPAEQPQAPVVAQPSAAVVKSADTFLVDVPENFKEGDLVDGSYFKVQIPGNRFKAHSPGNRFKVQIPAGLKPGDKFLLKLAAPAPHADRKRPRAAAAAEESPAASRARLPEVVELD